MKEPAHDGERLSARDGRMDDRERETHADDDERLSAFLDGRLSDREREALLADLDVPGDDYEVLAETAAILRALEEEDALPPPEPPLVIHAGMPGTESAGPEAPPPEATPLRAYVVRPRAGAARGTSDAQHVPEEPGVSAGPRSGPHPVRPRNAGWRRRAATIAAVLALTLTSGLLVRARSSGAVAPVALAGALERADPRLLDEWQDGRTWAGTRGPEGAGVSAEDAARAGAMLVDLSVAVLARDADETRKIAQQLDARYLRVPSPNGPFVQIIAKAGADPDSLRPLLAAGTERLEENLGRDALRAGAWVEAAGLAAHAQDENFFRARATRAPPRVLEQLVADDASGRAALDAVRALISADGPPRWEQLRSSLRALLSAVAG